MKNLKKILSLLGIISIFLPMISDASGSFTLYDLPTMYLNIGISATQVNSIQIAAPYRNGVAVAIPAMSGAIFQFTQNAKQENIYAARVGVDPSTKIITLYGVVRDLCFNQSVSFTGCSTGQNFQKGAQILLTDDARIFNLKANVDTQNLFSSSGAIAFSGSGSFAFPTFATVTARNQELGSTVSGPVKGSCVTVTGLCYLSTGGAWTAITAGAGNSNASELNAGIMQISTIANLRSLTSTGSTGALNVVPNKWVVKNGTGALSAGRIPSLNQAGVLSSSFVNMAGSGVVITKSGTGLTVATATSSGYTLMTNQNGSWKPSNNLGYVLKRTSGAPDKITSYTTDTNFASTVPLGVNLLSTGSVLFIHISGSGSNSTTFSRKYGLKLGSTELCRSNFYVDQATTVRRWLLDATITTSAAGATGKIMTDCKFQFPYNAAAGTISNDSSGSTVTINTTNSNTLNVFSQGSTTNGTSWLIQLFAQLFP